MTPITGLMTVDAFDRRRLRPVLQCAHCISSCRRRCWATIRLPYISRMTRSLMLGQLHQEYILTAGEGSSGRIVWKRHGAYLGAADHGGALFYGGTCWRDRC